MIDRELRLRARQALTYWGRCAVAAIAVLVSMEEIEVANRALTPAQVGRAAFDAVTLLGLLVAGAATLVTADCLSRERREGTLGLLLLTDLSGLDVVFGKLCVAGLTAAYVLVGFLPAVGLLGLLGGVSVGEIGRAGLALLNLAFVALAAGMWISGRAQGRSGAARGSLLLVLALCAVPRIAMYFGLVITPMAVVVAAVSPYTTFVLAPDAQYQSGGDWQYWLSLGVSHAVGWGLLAWTALRLRFNWKAIEWAPPPKRVEWAPANEVEAQALAAQRVELKQKDPLCWAVSRMRMQNALIWTGALVLLIGGTGFTWSMLTPGPVGGPAAMGIWSGIHLLLSVAAAGLLAWASGRFFFEAQRNGELELLLSTPLGAAEIVGANWRALCQPLRGAWLLVAFLAVLQLVFGHGSMSTAAGAGMFWGFLEKALPVAVRVMDIIALCWMGMWFGLQARKPISIMAWSAGLVVGLPWVLSYVFVIFLSLGSSAVGSGGRPGAVLGFSLFVWPILNLLKDAIFIGWAVTKLRAELRTKVSLAAGGMTE